MLYRSLKSAGVITLISALLASCNESLNTVQQVKLDNTAPAKANPFVTVPRLSAIDTLQLIAENTDWSGTSEDALFSAVSTGSDLLDAENHWRCSTASPEGSTEVISVRLLEDQNGFVDYQPVLWHVSDSDKLSMIVPDKGTITWQNVRFSADGGWPEKLFAEDVKGETAECLRIES